MTLMLFGSMVYQRRCACAAPSSLLTEGSLVFPSSQVYLGNILTPLLGPTQVISNSSFLGDTGFHSLCDKFRRNCVLRPHPCKTATRSHTSRRMQLHGLHVLSILRMIMMQA